MSARPSGETCAHRREDRAGSSGSSTSPSCSASATPAFDEDSVDVARFITHLRFLFVRSRQRADGVSSSTVYGTDTNALLATLRATKLLQYASAARIAALLEELFSWSVDEDEMLYLSLHVARLTASLA